MLNELNLALIHVVGILLFYGMELPELVAYII